MKKYKVKIIEVWGGNYDYDEDMRRWIVKGITEWTEVTDEEYQVLQGYVGNYGFHERQRGNYDTLPQLLLLHDNEDHMPVNVLDKYLEDARKVKAEGEARLAKEKEKQRKNEEKRRQKVEAKEKALLEELRQKYEGQPPMVWEDTHSEDGTPK